uniref:Glutaminyl-peptide cyclotransferase n=1 Tax=Chenopodium quinoa TaxID=63459 RepID=A0A803MWL1_CHEQI
MSSISKPWSLPPKQRLHPYEGLLYEGNNTLYESTGLYGEIELLNWSIPFRREELYVWSRHFWMSSSYFGEGLTLVGERLYQLTYDQNTGFIYDRTTLSKLGIFNHQMKDGWGLTTDGKIMFGSDGSSTLYHIDPHTMKVIKRQNVRYKDLDVHYLNVLEYVHGEVWANVFRTDCIIRISPEDGTVLGWILLPMLRERLEAAGEIEFEDVLNGIAWDNDEKRIFVTGKLWPKLYEIKVHSSNDHSQVDIERMCIQMPASLEGMK